MRPNFLQRYSSTNNNSSFPTIRQRTEQSQVFITNPITAPRLRQSLTLPALAPNSPEIELREAKELYEALVEQTNEVKIAIEKIKCEYREASRKIKQVKIHAESEIKKIESCTHIDQKFLYKNWTNMPKISFQYIEGQLNTQQAENSTIYEVIAQLNKKVGHLEDQIG